MVIATLTSGDVHYFESMGQTLCWPLDIYSEEEPVRKSHEDVKLCIKPSVSQDMVIGWVYTVILALADELISLGWQY